MIAQPLDVLQPRKMEHKCFSIRFTSTNMEISFWKLSEFWLATIAEMFQCVPQACFILLMGT